MRLPFGTRFELSRPAMRVQIALYLASIVFLTAMTYSPEPVERLNDLQAEIDLAIRNARSTKMDLQRELREMQLAEVTRFIPEARTPAPHYVRTQLKQALDQLAENHGIRVEKLQIVKAPSPQKKLPKVVLTTQKPTWFDDDSIAETIHLRLEGSGKISEARDVLLESSPAVVARSVTETSPGHWVAEADTYRFRNLKLPVVRPQDPAHVIPASLLQQKPELAQRIEEIRSRIPESEAAFGEKARFMYYGARMSFFLRKVPPRS